MPESQCGDAAISVLSMYNIANTSLGGCLHGVILKTIPNSMARGVIGAMLV